MVGLTMGAAGLRAVRITRGQDGLRIDGSLSVEFPLEWPPHPSELEAALRQVSDTLLNDRTRLIVGLRPPHADLRIFDPPFEKAEKNVRVLKYTAEPLFLTPVENLVMDYLPLPGEREGAGGLVFGASPEAIQTALDDIGLGGLRADVVLPERLGLVLAGRVLFPGGPTAPGLRLLLDLGAQQTTLALFEDDRMRLIRSVHFGGRQMTMAMAENLNMEPLEAEVLKRETDWAVEDPEKDTREELWAPLVLEIKRTLVGFLAGQNGNMGQPDLEIVISGGGSRASGLAEYLTRALGLPARVVTDFLDADWGGATIQSDQISALGLALSGFLPGRRPNLLQGTLAPLHALKQFRTPLLVLGAGLLIALAMYGFDFYYQYRLQSQRYTEVKNEINQIFRQTLPHLTRIQAPLPQMRQEVEKARQASGALPSSGKVLDILLDISKLTSARPNVRITDFALTPDTVELTGEGGSYETIDELQAQLSGLPYLSQVTVGGARMDPNTKVLNFKVTMKRKAE